tara:strand:+ start:4743 stop:5663 length:921 start_codon:yes stop_codon:yes gene_type:complete
MANVLSQQKEKLVEDVLASPKDFFELMKPRVMSLVVFTAFVGYLSGYCSTSLNINPWLSLIGIFSIALGAGSSGVLNHWYDRDIDKLMDRTKNRPIPLGKILPSDALVFGILGSILSVSIIGLSINWLAAFYLGFTIIFYSVVYTIFLKRSTSQNIVIGGASGAFPPVIGYICATGQLSIEPFILFGIIFLWTPPHFWALAIIRKREYLLAGIPMLPVTSGDKNTRKQIFIYSLILFLFSFLPYILGFNHFFYLSFSTLIGLEFLRRAWLCLRSIKNSEQNLFTFSIFYLFSLFLVILIEKLYLYL